jgi:hypothetical protein
MLCAVFVIASVSLFIVCISVYKTQYNTIAGPLASSYHRRMKTSSHSGRTKAGMAKAAVLGRRPGRPERVSDAAIIAAIPLGTIKGARRVGLSKGHFIARRRRLEAALSAQQPDLLAQPHEADHDRHL